MKLFEILKLRRIANIFSKQFTSITSIAFLIGITGLASRVLGFFRDHTLAYKFGANQVLDIYYVAFRIPDMIYNLVVLGALSAGFIPIFTSHLKINSHKDEIKGNDSVWYLVNIVLNWLCILIIFISLVGIIFANEIITKIAPGFDLIEIQKATGLTKIMFLSPIFLCISAIFGGVLQSFKKFFAFSVAPILYNVGIIIGVLYFYDFFGIDGLAYGVALGAFLHMLVQVPFVFNLGYEYRFILDFKNLAFRKIFLMMIPRTLSLAISQINLIVITILATNLPDGNLSIFNFANNLQSVPIGLFGISFAIASFPLLSIYIETNNKELFLKTFSSTTSKIIFFTLPITFLFIVFRAQIVRILLGRGEFDWYATVLTFNALGIFAISIVAQSLIPFFTRVFYVFKDSKTPFFISLFCVITNIFISLKLVDEYGILGLVFAFTITSIIQVIFLLVMLRYKLGRLDLINIIKSFCKVLVASILMAIFSQGAKYFVSLYININTFLGIFIQTFISILIGILVFCLVSLYLKNTDIIEIKKSINKKVFKKSNIPLDNLVQ